MDVGEGTKRLHGVICLNSFKLQKQIFVQGVAQHGQDLVSIQVDVKINASSKNKQLLGIVMALVVLAPVTSTVEQ
ncbi:hypothetical protein VNO77_42408 [Canavalia gladiata]|uniref:Uncharacterized protein n=1 Tax=Canavalia gladiata TaxID=3824 RepID=A0AAN9JSR4_CANGL